MKHIQALSPNTITTNFKNSPQSVYQGAAAAAVVSVFGGTPSSPADVSHTPETQEMTKDMQTDTVKVWWSITKDVSKTHSATMRYIYLFASCVPNLLD